MSVVEWILEFACYGNIKMGYFAILLVDEDVLINSSFLRLNFSILNQSTGH